MFIFIIMKNFIKIILESVSEIKKFEDKYDLSLPEDITDTQLKDLKEAFSYLPDKFIKHHIKNIVFADLGAVHGKYIQEHDILPWSKEPWVSQFEMVYSLD
jgi:hypothetical protein